MDSLERIKSRLKNLRQNKDKTEEELTILAKDSLNRAEIIGSLKFCISDEEKEFATNLLENYLRESSLSSYAEKDTLRQLIDLEVIIERVKDYINKETEKANPCPPLHFLEQMQELNKQIVIMKKELGLAQSKDEKNDASKIIEDLKERFHQHINKPENRSNYEFQCPKCAEIFLLRKRLDKITDEVVEHPWFIEGGVLFNKEIFKDLELGKISEDQVARYLNATLDYISWIKIHYPLNQDKETIDTEQND